MISGRHKRWRILSFEDRQGQAVRKFENVRLWIRSIRSIWYLLFHYTNAAPDLAMYKTTLSPRCLLTLVHFHRKSDERQLCNFGRVKTSNELSMRN